MDTQRKIIALLQGELHDRKQVRELMYVLASSPQETDLLLQQLDLSRRTRRLGNAVPSNASSASRILGNRIDQFEAGRPSAPLFISPQSPDPTTGSTSSGQARFFLLIGIALVMAMTTLGIGYLIGLHSISIGSTTMPDAALPAATHSRPNPNPHHNPGVAGNALSVLQTSGVIDRTKKSVISEQILPTRKRSSPQSPSGIWQPEEVHSSSLVTDSPISLRTISTAPLITLLAPQGGEQFGSGDIVPVVWSTNGEDAPLSIEMSDNGGLSWQPIAEEATNNRFLWTIPPDAKTSSQYLLKLTPSADEQTSHLLKRIQASAEGISVDVSPDGRYIATGGLDTMVTIRELATGELVAVLAGHRGPIQSCRYSYDGSKLVTSALDGTAIIWDVASHTAEHILNRGRRNYVWWAAFSPDGTTVATAQDNGTVIFWDAMTGKEQSELKIHDEGVRFLKFTRDGSKLLTSSTDRTAAISDIRRGMVLQRFVHHAEEEHNRNAIVNCLELSEDGSTAITCGHDGFVKFWDVSSGQLIRSRVYHGGEEVSMVALSPDGKVLISAGTDGTGAMIDPGTGAIINRMVTEADKPGSSMVHIGFGLDPRSAVISHMNGEVTLWNVRPEGVISEGYWAIRERELEMK